jgi:hypothetical protein
MSVGPSNRGTAQSGDMTLYRAPQLPPQSAKEAESASNFRMFEAIQALRDGKLPTNEQLIRTIDSVMDSDTLHRKKSEMSEDGGQFVEDLLAFLEAAKHVVEEKNADEDIQEVGWAGLFCLQERFADYPDQFIFHSRLAATSPVAKQNAAKAAEASKEAGAQLDPKEVW